jgi:hypothetical protein
MKKSLLIVVMLPLIAYAGITDIEREGERDGKQYAEYLRSKGITVDGTYCAIGMAAEDNSRPNFSQEEIEAYAKAFGNACVGHNVFR